MWENSFFLSVEKLKNTQKAMLWENIMVWEIISLGTKPKTLLLEKNFEGGGIRKLKPLVRSSHVYRLFTVGFVEFAIFRYRIIRHIVKNRQDSFFTMDYIFKHRNERNFLYTQWIRKEETKKLIKLRTVFFHSIL